MNALKRWLRGKFIGTGCALLALCSASAVEPPNATEGSVAAADQEAFLGRTVALPPYVVSAMRSDKHPWRYGSVPGFEVLTRASDAATCSLLVAQRRGLWVEDTLLPESWRPSSPVPYTVIAADTDQKSERPSELYVAPRRPGLEDTLGFAGVLAPHITTEVGGDIDAGDSDTRALNINLYDVPESFFRHDFGLERLRRCAPSLPPWLMAGLAESQFSLFGAIVSRSVEHKDSDLVTEQVIFRGARWVSNEETGRLQKEIKAKKGQKIEIPFIPLGRFFTGPPRPGESRALWESEAALFVRWGLFDPKRKGPAWRPAFMQFVQRARYEPVTEPMFTECFGQGFGAMEQTLTDYLQEVIAQPVVLDMDLPQKFSTPNLKPATADQIGRILGDWLRMRGRSMRQKDPAMGAKLLAAAERMLTRAYAIDNGLPPDVDPAPQGARTSQPMPQKDAEPVVRMAPFVVTAERIHDPGLLAIFGLYEHDIGDDAKARPFLEKAVQAGVIRPKAYVVLALLRYAEAIARPLDQGGKLSAPQAAFILEPARVALKSYATAETWGLIVETLARCEARPSAVDIEKIVGGVSRFPENSHLALQAAQLCVQAGSMTRAAELIDKSLVLVTDEDTRRELQKLRSSLATGGSSP